jgi:hypothetical protein
MDDPILVDDVAKETIACFGQSAPKWLQEQIELASRQHDEFSADAWRDIAAAVSALLRRPGSAASERRRVGAYQRSTAVANDPVRLDEPAWLRHRIKQLRRLKHRIVDSRAVAATEQLIVEAQLRLERLSNST